MTKRFKFDESYYRRHYTDPCTRVASPMELKVLADFVCTYLKHLKQPVRRVLDIGCGLGAWRKLLQRHYPRAGYTGVEISDYLCQRYGWQRGSVVDFRSATPFDLVICQGVLQYLSPLQATKAIENLATLCRGAMYLEVLTKEDWDYNCDRDRTDGNVFLRNGDWYRRRLARSFVNAGGGLFIHRQSTVTLYELEKLGP